MNMEPLMWGNQRTGYKKEQEKREMIPFLPPAFSKPPNAALS
jgi:hypothetical protein